MALGLGFGFGFTRGGGAAAAFNELFPNSDALWSLRNLNDPKSAVVRVLKSTDNAEQNFTAAQVRGGTLLDFVVTPAVQALYSNAMWFDGTNNYVDFNFVPSGNDSFRTRGTINLQLNSSVQAILGNRGAANTGFFLLTINQTSSTYKLRPHINTNTGLKSFDSVATLTYGVEYTVDVRADLSGNFELWIDGVFDSQIDISTNTAFVWGIGTFRAGARADTAADRALGYIRNVEYYRAGVLVSDWLINGNTNADVVDNTGSNNGTVVGSPALFTGQGFNGLLSSWIDQRVSTAQDRMYFGRTSPRQYIGLGLTPALGINGSTKVEFKATVNAPNDANNKYIFNYELSGNNSGIIINLNGTTLTVGGRSQASDGFSFLAVTVPVGEFTFSGYLDFTNDEIGISVNNGAYTTTPAIFGSNTLVLGASTFEATIGAAEDTLNTDFQGTIYDCELYSNNVLIHKWDGYGNLNEDWTDKVGSTNGTVVGSPRRCLPDLTLARDAIQTTAADQPLVVENGALVTLNGKPAIKNSSGRFLEVPGSIGMFNFLHNGSTSSVFGVASFGSSGNPNAINTLLSTFNGSSLNIGYFLAYDDRGSVSANNAYLVRVGNGTGSGQYPVDNSVNDSITPQTQVIISSIVDANNATASARDVGKINNGSNLSNNVGTFAPSASNASNELQLFAADDSIHLQGFAQEVIIFASDQTSNRDAIIANQNAYYGVY